MSKVYVVEEIRQNFDEAIPLVQTFVCQNLYTAQQVLRERYSLARIECINAYGLKNLTADVIGEKDYYITCNLSMMSRFFCTRAGAIRLCEILDRQSLSQKKRGKTHLQHLIRKPQ